MNVAVENDLPLLMETLLFTTERVALLADERAEEAPLEELAPVLRDLAAAKRHLRDAESSVAIAAAARMSSRYATVNGIELERGGPSGSDKWETDTLLNVLLARSRDERRYDKETGEFESEASAFLRILKECAAVSYFRIGKKEQGTGLAGRGLDPEDYRTKPSGPRKAKVAE